MIYMNLFWEFFKIGLFTIGGGLAAVPFLRHLSTATGWFPISLISDMIAISESTPGPIGINMATYAGIHVGGFWGGLIATIGMITPSILIVSIVSGYLERFKNSQLVKNAFKGLRPAVTALIAVAGFDIIKLSLFGPSELSNTLWLYKSIFFICVFFLIRKYKKHPIVYIFFSGIIGIILRLG